MGETELVFPYMRCCPFSRSGVGGCDIIVGHYGGVTSVTPCLHARSTFTSALTSAETCLLVLDICTHLYTFDCTWHSTSPLFWRWRFVLSAGSLTAQNLGFLVSTVKCLFCICLYLFVPILVSTHASFVLKHICTSCIVHLGEDIRERSFNVPPCCHTSPSLGT